MANPQLFNETTTHIGQVGKPNLVATAKTKDLLEWWSGVRWTILCTGDTWNKMKQKEKRYLSQKTRGLCKSRLQVVEETITRTVEGD